MDKYQEDLEFNHTYCFNLQLDLMKQKQKTDEKYKIILKFAQDVYKIV
jgi:hypothetical protein